MSVAGEFGSEHHPAQHLTLIVHGVAAYAFLIVAGAMIPIHIRLGWNLKRNRKSGVGLSVVFLVLTLTALGIYYFGGEVWRHWASILHWTVGLIVLPALIVHVFVGRRSRSLTHL